MEPKGLLGGKEGEMKPIKSWVITNHMQRTVKTAIDKEGIYFKDPRLIGDFVGEKEKVVELEIRVKK